MLSELASEGALRAGREEAQVPFSLTLQWLESNVNRWPVTEAALLARIASFCSVTVDVGPGAVADALADLGLVDGGPDPASPVLVHWAHLEGAGDRLDRRQVARAMAAVVHRVAQLLLADRGRPQALPQTRAQLEAMIGPHCQVVFKAHPRAILNELEANEYLEVDTNTDVVKYNGPKIISWRQPPRNKGFGIGSFLLVILIILMMTPNALQALGIV